jgi:hypothetical protein
MAKRTKSTGVKLLSEELPHEEEEKSLEQLLAELSSKKGDIDWGELEDRRRADGNRVISWMAASTRSPLVDAARRLADRS